MNKLLGFIIIALYFLNFQICNFLHPYDVVKFWDLKVSIYSIIIILAIKYNAYKVGLFGLLESIFLSIILSNIISLYFFEEKHYSYSDFILIPTIIIIEYAKHYKRNLREYFNSFI
jgi:hypothetical protein